MSVTSRHGRALMQRFATSFTYLNLFYFVAGGQRNRVICRRLLERRRQRTTGVARRLSLERRLCCGRSSWLIPRTAVARSLTCRGQLSVSGYVPSVPLPAGTIPDCVACSPTSAADVSIMSTEWRPPKSYACDAPCLVESPRPLLACFYFLSPVRSFNASRTDLAHAYWGSAHAQKSLRRITYGNKARDCQMVG